LKTLTTEKLLNFTSLFSIPVFDTAVLPSDISTLYLEGSINPTDMIIGANTYDDFTLFSPADDYMKMVDAGIMNSWLWTLGDDTNMEERQPAVDAYPVEKYNGSSIAAFAQFQGDLWFNCATRDLSEKVSSKIDGNVYSYYFGHFSTYDFAKQNGLLDEANISDPYWATHGSELFFVFGMPFSPLPGLSTEDKDLSEEMMSRWANFARSGNPSASTESSSNAAEWLPVVPSNFSVGKDEVADPKYLYFTGDGGKMVHSNKDKMEQCASFPWILSISSEDVFGDDDSSSTHQDNTMNENENDTDNTNESVADKSATTNSNSSSIFVVNIISTLVFLAGCMMI